MQKCCGVVFVSGAVVVVVVVVVHIDGGYVSVLLIPDDLESAAHISGSHFPFLPLRASDLGASGTFRRRSTRAHNRYQK